MSPILFFQIQRYKKLRASLIEQLKSLVAKVQVALGSVSYMSTAHNQFKMQMIQIHYEAESGD